jgi:hypothetical protein
MTSCHSFVPFLDHENTASSGVFILRIGRESHLLDFSFGRGEKSYALEAYGFAHSREGVKLCGLRRFNEFP